MREDNIKDTKREKAIIKSRRMSIIGFIVAIALLTTAIVLAMNQEKAERQAKLDESLNSNNITISTNGKMGRNINEVRNELKLEAKKENAVSDSNSVDSKSASTDLSENNINNVNNVKQNDVISTNASSVSGKDGKNGKNKMADNKSVSLNNQNNQNNTTGQNNQNNQNKQNQSNTENNGDASKNANSTENKAEFIRPIEGETAKIFSMDSLIYSETLQEWVTHRGIDIKAEKGAEVKAIADGTIKSIKTDPRYGISIIIKHSKGFESVYACLLNEAQGLKEGDTIKQGQVIGNVGNSGVFESAEGMHLHFEMTKDGDYVNPDIYVK
jgi:murein DD-endopeptidase MepM/ murein hydrolase activator NlpD